MQGQLGLPNYMTPHPSSYSSTRPHAPHPHQAIPCPFHSSFNYFTCHEYQHVHTASLQAWLEAAWADGFDAVGAESLGGKVQGERKWIGTTEAATLLRSFGVQALIVDFMGEWQAGLVCAWGVESVECELSV